MRRFFAFFSANALQRIVPEPPSPRHDSLQMQITEQMDLNQKKIDDYVNANNKALTILIQNGRFKADDPFVVGTRKHLEEMQIIPPIFKQ